MATPGVCIICGDTAISAHLYPRALAHDMRAGHKHILVGSFAAPGRRIVQSGLVDEGILCAKHDNILGVYDTYGIQFCRSFASMATPTRPGHWRVPNVGSDKLQVFIDLTQLLFQLALSSATVISVSKNL